MGFWGGVIGGAVGFVASGFNPMGAAAGYAIGSELGDELSQPGEITGGDPASQYEAEKEAAKEEAERLRAEEQAQMEKSLYVSDARDEALMSAQRSIQFVEGFVETRSERTIQAEQAKLGLEAPDSEVSSDFEFFAGQLGEAAKEDSEDLREDLKGYDEIIGAGS
jgi:hypothetical protein